MTDYAHVAPKDEVDNIPEWAADVEVGDMIRWRNSGEKGTAEVVGFSTLYKRNYPAIEAPPEADPNLIQRIETVAITEKSWGGRVDA